jgi:predicted DCC family thiol-disulfide oxidoreductase YuxK
VQDGKVDRPAFLFDGDCAFCSSCARFIERHIRPTDDVVAWQFTDLGAAGVTREQVTQAVALIRGDRSPVFGPAAIAGILRASRGPWAWLWRPAGHVLGLRPVTALAWPAYRLVARNRHRLPGGTAACALPPHHPARDPLH